MSLKEKMISLLKEYGILKADETQKEEMVSYEVIYESDVKDSHGNWASRETLEKACENFNEYLRKGVVKSNLFHVKDTEYFSVEDTWIQKELDVIVEQTGEKIKAGTWVAKLKYHNEDLWNLKKLGFIGGVSVGCVGIIDPETKEILDFDFSGESCGSEK